MGQGVRSTPTTQQWAETIKAKVQTIAGQLGVKRDKLTDVNFATPEQLQSLSGRGPLYANRIVEGRPYQRTDELVKKDVLPQVTYDRMKNQIVVKQP
ncbi:MAG: helix-hairpin-helix domain-containing protein [Nitrospirae bacterium]|nr:helix-hairpin-helix domain-containing protein [Nitrospirota bacterium]